MADDQPPRQQLIDQILYGSAGLKATEEAIQAALQTVVQATAQEVAALVKNNAPHPELQQDLLKLEQSVVKMTMDAVKAIQEQIPKSPPSSS
jgi:hypothetical protein